MQAVVTIGREGLSDAVVAQIGAQLTAHELIKVRLGSNALEERHDAAQSLAARTDSALAQVLGNTILLYRRHPEKPRIQLPLGA